MTHYIIVWTGGYEAPCYEYRVTEAEAWDLAYEWATDAEDGDTIDVLVVDTTAGTVTRIEGK